MVPAIHNDMDLMALVNDIKSFPGITRKKTISEVINFFPKFSTAKVLASYGEDAAVVEWDDRVLLLAADGIMQALMNINPFYAGYYSVLVNINDISAMGGIPIGMVDVLSVKDNKVCGHVMRGMETAVRKFGVPIVGGHTHPDCTYNAIDVAIVGYCDSKDQVVYSHTAQADDDIIFAMDLDGFYPEGLNYAWDTTSRKESDICRRQMMAMNKIARKGLLRSGKDISNPGTLGTLGMLLETSGKGATVDIRSIPIPDGVDLHQWLKSYQGCGFTLTCDPDHSEKVMEMFKNVGVTGAVVGKVDGSNVYKLEDGHSSAVLFDFNTELITGCKPTNTVGWESLETNQGK
jgi:putative methanogenesis marker protein 2